MESKRYVVAACAMLAWTCAAHGQDTAAPTLSYGPVLDPRAQQAADAVPDTADTRPQAAQARAPDKPLTEQQLQELKRRAARRHPAWQGTGPMAPRPLRAAETPAVIGALPTPVPQPGPRPTVPNTSVIRACQGIVCTDAAGNTFNGSGNAGVSSTGRACARNGTTVTCF